VPERIENLVKRFRFATPFGFVFHYVSDKPFLFSRKSKTIPQNVPQAIPQDVIQDLPQTFRKTFRRSFR